MEHNVEHSDAPQTAEEAAQQTQNERTEAHLKKALTSWNAGQQTRSDELADTRLVPAATVAIKAEKAATRRPSRARVVAPPAPPAKKQPFRMSYDGSSISDYVQTLLAKGSR